jgi:oligosaccharide repeat unit polymerase
MAFIAISAAILYCEIRRESGIDVFSPVSVFLFITFLFFLLPELFSFNNDTFQNVPGEIYVLISMIFFFAGYVCLSDKTGFRTGSVAWVSRQSMYLFCAIFVPISMIIFLGIIMSYGGLVNYLSDIWNASRSTMSGKAYLVEIMSVPALASYFLFADYFTRKRRSELFLAAIVLVFGATLTLIISAERGSIVIPLFTIFVIRHYLGGRFKARDLLLPAAVVIFLILILGSIRDYVQFGNILKEDYSVYLGAKDMAAYFILHTGGMIHDVYSNIIENVPDRLNYQYGMTYLVFAIKFVPRMFIPDKIQGASQVLMEKLYPDVSNVYFAPSYLGELYMNFGFAGIIVGAFVFGLACGWLYAFLKNNIESKLAVILYATLLPSVISQMRGDFGNASTGMLTSLFKILVVYLLLRMFDSAARNVKIGSSS